MLHGKWKLLLLGVLALGSGALAHRVQGPVGLTAASVGAGFGSLLCLLSHLAMRRAQKAGPRLLAASVFLGVATSFLSMGVFVFTLAYLRREWLVTATLTALVIYTTFRLTEAFEVSRILRGKTAETDNTVRDCEGAEQAPNESTDHSAEFSNVVNVSNGAAY